MNGFRDLTEGEGETKKFQSEDRSDDRLSLFVYLTMCTTWILLLTMIVKIRLIKRIRKIRNFFPAEDFCLLKSSRTRTRWEQISSLPTEVPSYLKKRAGKYEVFEHFLNEISSEKTKWKGSILYFPKFRGIWTATRLAIWTNSHRMYLFSAELHNLKRRRSKNFYNASLFLRPLLIPIYKFKFPYSIPL